LHPRRLAAPNQVLAEALGGRVGRNPSGRFVLGVERVAPTRQLARLPEFERIVMRALDQQQKADHQQQQQQERQQEEVEAGSTGGVGLASAGDGGGGPQLAANASACGACFRVLESHGDQILELPPGAVALASSGSAAYELWALGDRLIAFQFHSESSITAPSRRLSRAPGRLTAPVSFGWVWQRVCRNAALAGAGVGCESRDPPLSTSVM
jgi:GMP synthase-like glutamine amidotransferase